MAEEKMLQSRKTSTYALHNQRQRAVANPSPDAFLYRHSLCAHYQSHAQVPRSSAHRTKATLLQSRKTSTYALHNQRQRAVANPSPDAFLYRHSLCAHYQSHAQVPRSSAHRTKATRKPASKPASRTKKSKTASGNTRPPSSSSSPPPSLPPTPPPVPVPAPIPTPTPVPPAATVVVVPSSPPRASSLVPGPLYDLEIEYTLRVNKVIKVKNIAICNQREFVILDLDDMVEQMSGDVLVRDIDQTAESLRGCDILEIRVDVKLYNLVTIDRGVVGVSITSGFVTRPSIATIDTSAGFLSLLKVNPYTRRGKGKKRLGSTNNSSAKEERKRHRKRVEDLKH
ncbi:hypothetical protein BU23DRAFT_567434 [Bimuria novae-zelandiae CBS 107.79]|uniref:Uncharacterized protein n=1 Tax=Bimuria novae-zelandiae CBS 107.79 TaxID=1447943 RepID=A0A6A5VHV4_9PLEO|nr:hypothetical protein BU23DRAFT_567434 [Bimuria novae-zelandiae CBS 107.79]